MSEENNKEVTTQLQAVTEGNMQKSELSIRTWSR